jgi:hypothetical protein
MDSVVQVAPRYGMEPVFMGAETCTGPLIFCRQTWEVQYITGENLEVVSTEFSTLSWAVLLDNIINLQHANAHF